MLSRHSLTAFAGLLATLITLSSCGKDQRKFKKERTFAELSSEVVTALETNKKGDAIRGLELMMDEYADHQDITKYRLALGDLYFDRGKKHYNNEDLQSAYELYKKFYKLNPSDEKAEYASYRAILAKFYQTQKIDCDTKNLAKAMKRAQKHLANTAYKKRTYHDDVRDILYTCERKLIDKEIYVFNTYLRQGKKKSAENRLKCLRESYLEKHPDLEPKIMYLECKLKARKDGTDEAAKQLAELKEKYPDSTYVTLAQNLVDRRQSKGMFTF